MDNYNPDLIFDLAAGLLPDDDARAAEASLSPEGRAELAAQRAVMAAISNEPPAAMTDAERAGLHRAVADGIAETTRELSPASVARPKAAARRARSVRWMRWASAVTATALVVGVVAVGSQLSTQGSPDAASDTTTTFADAAADSALSATTAAGAAMSTTTAADVTPSAGDGGTEELSSPPPLEAPPVRDDANPTDLWEVDRFVQEALQTQRALPLAQRNADPSQPCYARASQGKIVVFGFLAPYENLDGEEIDAIGYAFAGTDPENPEYSYYRPDTCEQLLSNTE